MTSRQLYSKKLTLEKQRDFRRALRYRTRRAGITIRGIALIAAVKPNSLRTWLYKKNTRIPAAAAASTLAALDYLEHLQTSSPNTITNFPNILSN